MVKTFGPYSPIRKAGDFYFLSGQVGVHPETKVADKTIAEQTEQALDNVAGLLASVGLTLQDVVKTVVYLTDMADFAAMNETYAKHFQEPYPARSTVAVKELPRVGGDNQIKVEIEVIAGKAV